MFTLLGRVLDFSSFEVFILYLKCSIFQALGCQRPELTGCFCCMVTVSKICKGWDRRNLQQKTLIVVLVLGFCIGVVISQKNESEALIVLILMMNWFACSIKQNWNKQNFTANRTKNNEQVISSPPAASQRCFLSILSSLGKVWVGETLQAVL